MKQFKCLQISFLFSLCPKQAPDVELQKKQTDFLFVEGGIQVDYIIFFFFYFLGLFSSEVQAGMLWQVAG